LWKSIKEKYGWSRRKVKAALFISAFQKIKYDQRSKNFDGRRQRR
jgi:hypothetical protein